MSKSNMLATILGIIIFIFCMSLISKDAKYRDRFKNNTYKKSETIITRNYLSRDGLTLHSIFEYKHTMFDFVEFTQIDSSYLIITK